MCHILCPKNILVFMRVNPNDVYNASERGLSKSTISPTRLCPAENALSRIAVISCRPMPIPRYLGKTASESR